MEPKIDPKSIIFQVGAPEGLRGRFWKDFGPILEQFWDDSCEGFWTYINARTRCVPSARFFVLVKVVGDIAALLPSFWI